MNDRIEWKYGPFMCKSIFIGRISMRDFSILFTHVECWVCEGGCVGVTVCVCTSPENLDTHPHPPTHPILVFRLKNKNCKSLILCNYFIKNLRFLPCLLVKFVKNCFLISSLLICLDVRIVFFSIVLVVFY